MQSTSICLKSLKIGLIDFYLNRVLNICLNFTALKKNTKFKTYYLRISIQNHIECKINKFLKIHKIGYSTFKQNENINTKMKRKQKLAEKAIYLFN